MKRQRHRGLIAGLRGELSFFARVAFLVLAVPLFLHPLAEASAAAKGEAGLGVICTAFGAALDDATTDLAGFPDDCPCGTPCTMHGLAAPIVPEEPALAAPLAEPAAGTTYMRTASLPPPAPWLRPPGRAPPVPS